MMSYIPRLKTKYREEIVAKLHEQFGYKTVMQVPRLLKISVNQGVGGATQDKKMVDNAVNEMTTITGQKAVSTIASKSISNFKLENLCQLGPE
jgi:large subunit ribosomal protein L5